jgi:biopolymer transport protein ExbD
MTPRGPILALAVVALAGAACGQEPIGVRPSQNSDYNHAALLGAVDQFVAAGRTPAAYAELSRTVLALRPGMDRSVASEAELKLLVLALGPTQSVQARPVPAQVEALATTVWPTLLAPAIEADGLLDKRDPRAADWLPEPSEDAGGYLVRLCGGALSAECKRVVPELQGPIVAALATRRATERVRNAVAECVMCSAEPGWHEAVRSWEALDRMLSAARPEVERRAAPDNWPVAGNAAEPDPQLPEAEIDPIGEVVIGGQHYGAAERIAALRDLRGTSPAIALHLRPEVSLAQVRGVLDDAHKAGATRVAVIARVDHYPWPRRIYWIAGSGAGYRAGLRPTDSLQLALHATDVVAAVPGTVARVD